MNTVSDRLTPLLFLSLATAAGAQVPDIPPPFSNPLITSDFGPRNEATPYHEGVDIHGTAGAPIPAMEAGEINRIFYQGSNSGGWVVRFASVRHPGFQWAYAHLFSDGSPSGSLPVASGRFKLMKAGTPLETVIVRYADARRKIVERVFSEKEPRQVKIDGSTYTTRNTFIMGEAAAPVGDSGSGGTHLHIALRDPAGRLINPLLFMEHAPIRVHDPRQGVRQVADAVPVVTPIFPVQDAYLRTRWKGVLFAAHVKSLEGLDLDRLDIKLSKPGGVFVELGSNGAFNLGGFDPGKKFPDPFSKFNFASRGGLSGRLGPVSTNPGFDQFQFREQSLAAAGTGQHVLSYTAVDVNGLHSGEAQVAFGFVERPKVEISTEATAAFANDQWKVKIPVTVRSAYPGLAELQFWSVEATSNDARLASLMESTIAISGESYAHTFVISSSTGKFAVIAKDKAGIYYGTGFALSSHTLHDFSLSILAGSTTQATLQGIENATISPEEGTFWVPQLPGGVGEVSGPVVPLSTAIPSNLIGGGQVPIGGFLNPTPGVRGGLAITAAGWREISQKYQSNQLVNQTTTSLRNGGPSLQTFVESSDAPGLTGAASFLDRRDFNRGGLRHFLTGSNEPPGPPEQMGHRAESQRGFPSIGSEHPSASLRASQAALERGYGGNVRRQFCGAARLRLAGGRGSRPLSDRRLGGALQLALDVRREVYDGRTVLGIGTEYAFLPALSLRAGYAAGSAISSSGGAAGLGGMGAGIGLHMRDYRADYTFAPFGELGNVQRLSLGARF